jgi:hypothetical protein
MRTTLAALLLLAACSGAPAPRRDWPEPAKLPVREGLPDVLTAFDGRRISTREAWEGERKPELRALFQNYMYGVLPPVPKVTATLRRSDPKALGGKATLKELSVAYGPAGCPPLELLVVVPNRRSGPAPVFVGLNFTGNHSLLADPQVRIPTAWMRQGQGVVNNRATEEGRGKNAAAWSIEQAVDRGYGIATFYYGDGLPDKPDYRDGSYPYFVKVEGGGLGPADCGGIAYWAWTIHRAVDYLVTDPDVDAKRIAVTGHSRNGKAALVAAAFDERIALAIPHQAGCGGTAPSRTKNAKAETVKAINDRFPHWFCGNFKAFNADLDRLPFDQHALLALCAPRPVLYSNAIEDQWADPGGQFDLLKAAEPVWKLLGAEGLADATAPDLGRLSAGRLGYFIRAGRHSTTPEDWTCFLDFADRHLKAR